MYGEGGKVYKQRAFFEKFSFLTGGDKPLVGKAEEVKIVAVRRIDRDFLGRKAKCAWSVGSATDIRDVESIFLLDKDGNVLVKVEQEYDDEEKEGETVGEALLRLQYPDDVTYAVVTHTGYEIRDHCSVGGSSVIVYKTPKGFGLKGWVAEQIRRAKEEISATVAEIDAEA